jgi:hypothetical protein
MLFTAIYNGFNSLFIEHFACTSTAGAALIKILWLINGFEQEEF